MLSQFKYSPFNPDLRESRVFHSKAKKKANDNKHASAMRKIDVLNSDKLLETELKEMEL